MSYWAKTYGPGEANAVAVDKNGDIIVATEEGRIARIDKEGNVKWSKKYSGGFRDVKLSTDRSIVATGLKDGDILVTKLSPDGNAIWTKTYGGEKSWDWANAVAITKKGDIIVAGVASKRGGVADVCVLRIDGKGTVIWGKTYGGSDRDGANAVAVAPNGDIIVAGYTYSFGAGRSDVWVLRLDENGNVKWQKTYGGIDWDEAEAVAIAPNGDIIVGGETWSFGAGKIDAWILRLDANGNVKWQKTYGRRSIDWATAVVIAPNGDIIVAGKFAWVLRLDENGNVKWQKTYGRSGYGGVNAVAVAPNGDIIVAGETESFGAGGKDVWILRIPPDGELKCFSWNSYRISLAMNSNATITETHAKVSRVGGRGIGGIFKKTAIIIREKPYSTGVKKLRIKPSVIYDSSNPKIVTFWKLVSEKRLEDAAELFEALHPRIAGALIKLFIPEPVITLEKEHEDKETAKVLLGLSNPYLNRLKVNVSLENDEDFTSERDSLIFTLMKGESFAQRVKITRAKYYSGEYRKKWNYFEVVFEFPDYETKIKKRLELKDEKEITYLLARFEANLSKKLELLRKATSLGHIKARKELEWLEKKLEPLKQHLQNSITLSASGLVEGIDSIIKLTVKNEFANSLKLTLDFSTNDFFELETTFFEFPELKKGHRISKTLTVTPKYAGSFDFRIKIKAIADGIEVETEKVTPIEVVEKTAQPYATPQTPATPATPSPQPITPSPAGLQLLAGFPPQLAYKYTDVELIGKGGFARVYKAKRRDGKVVAVKIPLSLDENTGKAFLREITNWLHLKHPNIVHLYDANVLPIPFLEMEYCESSLEKLPKPMKPREAALLIFNIAEGLKYAHSKGIIHRDLKPSNVLLKDSTPKISDWGLSKVVTETHTTTTVSYTPHYASPEQISRRFGRPDHRSDIWQLGVIFYELVTGRRPFEGDGLVEIASRITMDEPVPPSELNPGAREVEPVIMACLEKDMERRYQSAAELQFELATYLGISYKEELKRSLSVNNTPRAAFYAGQLMLVFLKMGNLKEAYKYASDLKFYTCGGLTSDVEALAEQIKVRLEEELSFAGEELLAKAEIIAHKVSLGFREV